MRWKRKWVIAVCRKEYTPSRHPGGWLPPPGWVLRPAAWCLCDSFWLQSDPLNATQLLWLLQSPRATSTYPGVQDFYSTSFNFLHCYVNSLFPAQWPCPQKLPFTTPTTVRRELSGLTFNSRGNGHPTTVLSGILWTRRRRFSAFAGCLPHLVQDAPPGSIDTDANNVIWSI